MAQADWCVGAQKDLAGVPGCYVYDFPYPHYGAKAGWISGMAQGEALSLLVRAYDATANTRYLSAAIGAATPFQHLLESGGAVWRSASGDAVLEEVAIEPPSHILNGHIFALWGLWDLMKVHAEPWVHELHEAALLTLRRRLPDYDSGFWSYYSALASRRGFRNLAVLKYHAFHIAQLRVTAAMTGDPYYREVADRWRNYQRSGSSRLRLLSNTVATIFCRMLTNADSVPGGARSIY
ncbi:MAG: D-glucuronyl C5-epimerase family protein [Candidatus Eremiobacteraeota bacterium]|nr:D-glucuronyl C5-epimerase family protein [Candidatus Eremiobacteraeota bacterium]